MSPSLRRHAAGFVVAPLVVPLLFLAVEVVRAACREVPPGYARSLVVDAVGLAVWRWAPLAWATALVLGAPILLALRAAHRLSAPWVVSVAAAVGATACGAVLVVSGIQEGWSGCESAPPGALLAAGTGVGGALGAIVSAVHCAVARVPLRRLAPPRPPGATSGASP